MPKKGRDQQKKKGKKDRKDEISHITEKRNKKGGKPRFEMERQGQHTQDKLQLEDESPKEPNHKKKKQGLGEKGRAAFGCKYKKRTQ